MSKAARLELLRRNIAKKTDNFESVDKDYSYAIWFIEKEFHVGMIDENFPLMKFWNIFDDDNIQRYKEDMEKDMPNSPKTMR